MTFDLIAPQYDKLWTDTPIGRAQRNQTWRHLDPLFAPGSRLLDIGCGTGEDAAHYTERGVVVHGTDPSAAMLELARKRGVQDAGQACYDAALSNFGPFNCVGDLCAAARDLAASLRPGAPAAICIIGRFCLWETLYYLVRLQARKAFRRLRGAAAWRDTTIYYPTVHQLAAAFGEDFTLTRWTGIALFVPPSYVGMPRPLVTMAAALDRIFAGLPGFRALCDHRLLIFTRK